MPRTAPAVAKMAPTERKDLTEENMRPSLGFRIRAIKPKRAVLVPGIGPQDNAKTDGTISPEVNYSFGGTLLPRDGIVRGEASFYLCIQCLPGPFR